MAEPVEQFVVAQMLELMDSARQPRTGSRQTNDAEKRADDAQAQMDELALAYGNQQVSLADWLTAKAPIELRLDAARREIAQAVAGEAVWEFAGHGAQLRKEWAGFSIERRASIIRALIDHVEIGPGRKGYNRFDPSRIAVSWRA